jgi:endo-1,4-beta-xylanase
MQRMHSTSKRVAAHLAALAGGFLVISLAAAAAAPQQPSGGNKPTLRAAAGDRLLIGAAVMSHQLEDPKLATLVAEQFNCLTAENEMKPENLQPAKGKFNFAPADKIAEFADKHGMKVVGHTLVWHQQTPKWMYQDDAGNPLPREQALANMRAHIDTVMKHYKGKVIGWDVVNEAISDTASEYLRDTPARKSIGDDYIAKAFEFAHAADPNVELYYNDYANENPEKRAKTIRLLRELNKAGVRIDGVGLQCHFMMKYPGAPQVLDEAIKAYAAEGVKVMITELDIDVLPRATSGAEISATDRAGLNPYANGLPAEVERAQTEFYRKTFDVVKKYPDVVTRVTLWGTHDGTSWLNNWPTKGRTNHALLWDRNLKPKPAYEAVLKSLGGTSAKSN